MKIIFLIFLLCILSIPGFGQDSDAVYAKEKSKADLLYKSGQFQLAALAYSEAFKAYEGKAYPEDRYNAGRAWAMAGNADSAFYHLFRLVTKVPDYIMYENIIIDTTLKLLFRDYRWPELLENICKAEINLNVPLMRQLEAIYDKDQKLRLLLDDTSKTFRGYSESRKELFRVINKQDSLDLIEVESIINQYGWPGEDLVRSKGNQAVFLVIQHSNLKTQEKYLPLMRDAVKAGKAKAMHLAYLEDRVNMRKGKKQIYGSQMMYGVIFDTNVAPIVYCNAVVKTWTFYPIVDEANVNKRRASVGLGPLEDIAKMYKIDYKVPEK